MTGALEIERKEKRIGSSLEAAPVVHVADPELLKALKKDLADFINGAKSNAAPFARIAP